MDAIQYIQKEYGMEALMLCYGQVIETYFYDDKPWISIWDLAKTESVDIRDHAEPPLKIGQCVSFVRQGRNISTVKKIDKSQLPAHVKPVI